MTRRINFVNLSVFLYGSIMKTINDFDFKNKKVLVRVDFNVPLDDNFQVVDATRIEKALPTIQKILNDGGSVILMSHLGRPKNKEEKFSLKHLIPVLEKKLDTRIYFVDDISGEKARQAAANLKPGEVLLLENLRFDPREKKGDESFAKELAGLADFYVNDAFGTAHRAHASTSVIAKFFPGKKAAGNLLNKEIENIRKVLQEGEHPVTAIIGGAKISTKLELLKNLLNFVDNLIIVGGMSYTFLRALGYNTGNSIVEKDLISEAKQILKEAGKKGVNVILPEDFVIADNFSPDAQTRIVAFNQIPDGWEGLDIGPKTLEKIKEIILNSKTIVWNGPAGVFEWEAFSNGTNQIASFLAQATRKGAFTLVGGGDSVAAVKKAGMENQVSYISTGGGALLEMLEGKELPGIKALEE